MQSTLHDRFRRGRIRYLPSKGRFTGLLLHLLCLPFLLTFLALLYLTHLTLNHLIAGPSINVTNFLLEDIQFLADATCLFFLSLTLADFTDGVFYFLVTLTQQFLSLFLGLTQYLLTLALYLSEFIFIVADFTLQ